jgi:hypothetical protein
MKYADGNDSFSGNRSTRAKLLGLKKVASIDFGAWSFASLSQAGPGQPPAKGRIAACFKESTIHHLVHNSFQFRRFAARNSARSSFAPSRNPTF